MIRTFSLISLLLLLTSCSFFRPDMAARQEETLNTLGFKKVDDGWKLILPDRMLFDFDKDGLKPELHRSIVEVTHQLLSVNIRQVRVEGHTDNIGPRDYNQELSLRRAATVAEVLIGEGFSTGNVNVKGFGSDRPVADNSMEAGRAQNRRVEIIILSDVLSAP